MLSFLLHPIFHQASYSKSQDEPNLRLEKLGSIDQSQWPALWSKSAFEIAYYGQHGDVIFGITRSLDSLGVDTTKQNPKTTSQVWVFVPGENGQYGIHPKAFSLPYGLLSNGATASSPKGLFFVGAASSPTDSLRSLSLRLSWDAASAQIRIDTFPTLPEGLAIQSLVYQNDQLVVNSRQVQLAADSGNIQNQLWELDLSLPNPQWMVLSDWSSKGSIGPQGTWQSNGIDNCLYFISGQSSTVPYSSGPTPSLTSMIHSFNPNQKSWDSPVAVKTEELASILIEPVGIYAMGTADIFAIGRQKRADETPSTERHLLVYHTILKNWNLLGELSAAPILHFFKLSNNRLAFLRWQMEEGEKPRLELLEVRVINQQQGLSWLNTIVLLLYFALLIALGFYFSRRQKDANDYFKGGQKIPWWAAGLSLYGTGLSAISYMAVPAKTYATDWAYFMTKLPQLLIPIIVGALFIPFYKKLNITTAYEYLERRFNLATRLVGSLSFIIFQLGRIGIVLFLPAVALNVATGIDIILCILLMGGISLIYTIMGGIEAVIWSDVLQVIILIGGILLCLVLISLGLDGGMQEVVAVGIEYKKFEIINMAFDFTQPTFWVVVLAGFFSQLITYSTDQTMVQRYLTTKDTQAARRSIWTSTLVSLSIGWIFFFMGTALFAYYQARPAELLPAMSANDAIFPWYIFSALPDGISGLLIAGIFAAAMSSLSSSMNSAATAYTIDFHQTFGWKGDELWVGKVATLVFGVAGITFALLFATMDIKSIWDEFLKIIGLIAGGLGGVFLLGIISTRANGAGALIGLFGSGVVQFMMAAYQPVHFLLFTATGFISCLVIGYLASFLFPTHGKAIDGLTVYG